MMPARSLMIAPRVANKIGVPARTVASSSISSINVPPDQFQAVEDKKIGGPQEEQDQSLEGISKGHRQLPEQLQAVSPDQQDAEQKGNDHHTDGAALGQPGDDNGGIAVTG